MPRKFHISARYLPAILTFSLGIALSLIGFAVVSEWEGRRRDYEFTRKIGDIALALERQINTDLDTILALGDFFTASQEVERDSFQRFVQRSLKVHPSLQLVAWLPKVPDEKRQDYQELATTETQVPFTITERDQNGELREAAQRSLYFPAYYLEPLAGNENAWGFDLASDPEYQKVLIAARDTGETVISRQIELIHDQGSYFGMLVIQPIYQSRTPPKTLPERRQFLQGFVLGVFRIQNIFEQSLAGQNTEYLTLYLVDETPLRKNSLLPVPDTQNHPAMAINRFQAVFSDQQRVSIPPQERGVQLTDKSYCPIRQAIHKTNHPCKRLLTIDEHRWSLYVLASSKFQRNQKYWRSWATLMMGLLWTFIPVTYMVTSLSRAEQIEKLARERSQQACKLQEALAQLEIEQSKSEELLLNVLPQLIAERLKRNETNIAETFADVTVLFGDIVGFTELSSRIPAPKLVQMLNDIFSEFDHLAERHGLEKIKTIGDAYMVVGGLPKPRPDHAEAIANMALDMQQCLRHLSVKYQESFSLRIGINTGPVVAGVIGIKRFIYDLWGDTVNIASRMESQGLNGCIQVTETTYEYLRDQYYFERRGTIQVKGKGMMMTYLLNGRKVPGLSPAFSVNLSPDEIWESTLPPHLDLGKM